MSDRAPVARLGRASYNWGARNRGAYTGVPTTGLPATGRERAHDGAPTPLFVVHVHVHQHRHPRPGVTVRMTVPPRQSRARPWGWKRAGG